MIGTLPVLDADALSGLVESVAAEPGRVTASSAATCRTTWSSTPRRRASSCCPTAASWPPPAPATAGSTRACTGLPCCTSSAGCWRTTPSCCCSCAASCATTCSRGCTPVGRRRRAICPLLQRSVTPAAPLTSTPGWRRRCEHSACSTRWPRPRRRRAALVLSGSSTSRGGQPAESPSAPSAIRCNRSCMETSGSSPLWGVELISPNVAWAIARAGSSPRSGSSSWSWWAQRST